MAEALSESYLFEAWYPPGVSLSVPSESDVDDYSEDDWWEDLCEETNTEQGSPFLSLPLEVRLCIYHWVHLMSPIRRVNFSPGYPMPLHVRYVLQPIRAEATSEDETTTTEACLSADRPLAGLPTSLLCTCRQIYFEARTLPFETNEFVFVNWLWCPSGLRSAAAVVGAMWPWQRRAVRYVHLEIPAWDLTAEEAWRDWAKLSLLGGRAGLRGLRVRIMGGAGNSGAGAGAGAGGEEDDDAAATAVDAARALVVRAGLACMRLERLEIELEFEEPAWDDRRKLAWCAEVQQALLEMGSGARVGCMERVMT